MHTQIMHIFTRTPLHVGAGASVGAIDMPIQRERHTQIPIIPGSSLKGVLRDLWLKEEKEGRDRLFGPESDDKEKEARAGELLVGEARVLCFPVRSAKGAFAWLTCPLALERYAREKGVFLDLAAIPDDNSCLAGQDIVLNHQNQESVVLEEYAFRKTGAVPPKVLALLAGILPADNLWATVAGRLVIVSDGIFAHFCANACEVQQRIQIDDQTGTVKGSALFNQENVSSETLFYAVMGERRPDALSGLAEKLKTNPILQIGGDETIGLGYCSVCLEGGAQ